MLATREGIELEAAARIFNVTRLSDRTLFNSICLRDFNSFCSAFLKYNEELFRVEDRVCND